MPKPKQNVNARKLKQNKDKLANDKRVAADLEIAQNKTIKTQAIPQAKKQILPKQADAAKGLSRGATS